MKLHVMGTLCLSGLLACASLAHAQDPAFEQPPTLMVQALIGDVALTTEHYEILEAVPTDGFMATITLRSPYGDFTASGPGMLEVRANDIRALAALDAIQADAQFTEAAEGKARETGRNLRQLVENPRETLEGVPEGVGRFFDRTGRALRTGVQKIDDVRHGQLPGVDPTVASNLPGGAPEPGQTPQAGLTETIARAGGQVAVNALGFDEQRRHLAQQLGVDPYSTNPVLAQKLDDVTWAAFAGGLGVNIVTSLIPGGMILTTSSQMTDWVWNTAPGDLRVEIVATLRGIGVPEDQIDRFLRHAFYPLSMQAVLASSLDQLDGVAGRAEVINLAVSVGSQGQARYVTQSVEMLANAHRVGPPLTALVLDGTVTGRTAEGAVVVTAPVDLLSWSETLATFTARFGTDGATDQILHIAGRATERARTELSARGWAVSETSALGPVAYPVR